MRSASPALSHQCGAEALSDAAAELPPHFYPEQNEAPERPGAGPPPWLPLPGSGADDSTLNAGSALRTRLRMHLDAESASMP